MLPPSAELEVRFTAGAAFPYRIIVQPHLQWRLDAMAASMPKDAIAVDPKDPSAGFDCTAQFMIEKARGLQGPSANGLADAQKHALFENHFGNVVLCGERVRQAFMFCRERYGKPYMLSDGVNTNALYQALGTVLYCRSEVAAALRAWMLSSDDP